MLNWSMALDTELKVRMTSDSSCPSRRDSLRFAVNFQTSNFQAAPAAMIWFAFSSVTSRSTSQSLVDSWKMPIHARTMRQDGSDSKPKSPEDNSGLQFRVREAEVSNVSAAQ